MLFAAIPLAFVLVTFYIFLRNKTTWEIAAVRTAAISGIVVTVSTEGLSRFHELSKAGVLLTWIAALLAASAWLWFTRASRSSPLTMFRFGELGLWDKLYCALIVVLFGAELWATFRGSPHIADTLYYHLPRIRHWLQEGSVDFYATGSPYQLFFAPWAEYAGAHWMALAGTERGVGLVQLLAMAMSAVAVSGIVRALGYSRWVKMLAAIVCLTIPQGVLQAYDIKNDFVCAMWIAATALSIVSIRLNSKWTEGIWLGCFAGLAILTKSTAYIYLLALIMLLMIIVLRNKLYKLLFSIVVPVVLLVFLINAPHAYRNWQTFGSPLGCGSPFCDGTYRFQNDAMSPAILTENFLRNAGLHMQTYDPSVNNWIQSRINSAITDAGGSINDFRSTWPNTEFAVHAPRINPDELGNNWHFALALVAGLIIFVRPRGWKSTVVPYSAAVAFAAILFCVVLRWQPWHTRLQLPIFVMAAPVIAIAFGRLGFEQYVRVPAVALFVAAYWVLMCYHLPQTAPAPWPLGNGVEAAAKAYRMGCREIAFDSLKAYYEEGAPLGALEAGTGGAKVDNIDVLNMSAKYAPKENLAKYCAIVCFACSSKPARMEKFRSQGFTAEDLDGATLLMRNAVP